MREFFINMLAKQAGFPRLPKDQKEFFNMAAGDAKFKEELHRLEGMGVLKRSEDGTLNIIDQDKVNSIVQNFIMKMLK